MSAIEGKMDGFGESDFPDHKTTAVPSLVSRLLAPALVLFSSEQRVRL